MVLLLIVTAAKEVLARFFVCKPELHSSFAQLGTVKHFDCLAHKRALLSAEASFATSYPKLHLRRPIRSFICDVLSEAECATIDARRN